MKLVKLFCGVLVTAGLSVSSITYADTCYDPNYDRYYHCAGDDYIAPVAAGVLFGAIIGSDYGYGGGHHGGGRHH